MGAVYDSDGTKIGSVNAWSGVYDVNGSKVGSVNIFDRKVYDSAGNFVGSADIYGNVCDLSGDFLCKVPFWGFDVKDASGNLIGSVEIAGAPEPMPDMQWRGAAALLLLCNKSILRSAKLDDLTFEYLSSPTSISKKKLVEYGKDIVFPLLRSLVKHLVTRGASVKSERQRNEIRETHWSSFAMDPLLQPAQELIASIGESAIYGLVEALLESDRYVQKVAALLLALTDSPSERIIRKLREVLEEIQVHDATMVMLLGFVLASGGDLDAQKKIERHAEDKGINVSGWITRTVDTAMLELLGWQAEVLS